jgi:hypothetical protein
MTHWILRALFASASFFAVSAYASDETYQLQLQVERNDVAVAKMDVDVNSGVDADLRIVEENPGSSQPGNQPITANDTEASIRIIAQVKRVDEMGGDVAVSLQYFEKQHGNWLLLGEPSIAAAPGEEGSVIFSNDSSDGVGRPDRYKITFTVEKKGQDQQEATPFKLEPEGCTNRAADTSSNGSADANAVAGLFAPDGIDPKCCSTKSMTCCGVKHCCDNRPGHGDCCGTK